jgi:phosphoribosylanthranilate isomerase
VSIDVKICGIRTIEGIEAANASACAYVGFVFFPDSPRFVTPEEAMRLRAKLRVGIRSVALLVDPDDEDLPRMIETLSPDFVQLHGEETPDRVEFIRDTYHRPIIKACPLATKDDLVAAREYDRVADMLLFDAKPANEGDMPGGNGRAFDWSLLAGETFEKPWLLSGGLTPENVGQAIRESGARAVDVSSGVEEIRGQKSPLLIQAFMAEVAKAAADLGLDD